MNVRIHTRKKASDHLAAFDRRNKEGVEKHGMAWIEKQEILLQILDKVIDRGETEEEEALIKDLVSALATYCLRK